MEQKQQNKNNNSPKARVSLADAAQWKKEAQAVGRSQSHLQKIEQVINDAPKTKVDNKPAITLDRFDALAFKKDRSDFQKMQSNNQQQPLKTQEISQFKGRKR